MAWRRRAEKKKNGPRQSARPLDHKLHSQQPFSLLCTRSPPRCAKERPKYRTSAYLITPIHCQVRKLSNTSFFLLKGFCSKYKTEMWEKKKTFHQFFNFSLFRRSFFWCDLFSAFVEKRNKVPSNERKKKRERKKDGKQTWFTIP